MQGEMGVRGWNQAAMINNNDMRFSPALNEPAETRNEDIEKPMNA